MLKREELLKNEGYWTEKIQNNIYNDLITYFEESNISRKELAKKLGVSKGRVSQILNGKDLNFKISSLVKIGLAMDKVPNFNFQNINKYIEWERTEDLISNEWKSSTLEFKTAISGLVEGTTLFSKKFITISEKNIDKYRVLSNDENLEPAI